MIRYVILDDEPIAHRIIEGFADKLPMLHKVGNAYNAFEALSLLKESKTDLLFLDINMPELSGFEFLKTLSLPPKIIVTSAYKEFALEGYELDVMDYLLKPFAFERFLKAVNKVILLEKNEIPLEGSERNQYIFIKSGKKQIKISLDDILFIEAAGNYCKVFLENQMILTLYKISTLEKELPYNFLRIHHSFIISKEKIQIIEGNQIKIGDHSIPIGQTYRSTVNKMLSR
ncbi:LytTR family DNA-binding domain-containing protein [uncultured Aquimarina sp.]|uniref:LytR/AlgR family response regulator transcription factor n=1 Tax=uncultured Aquimarina sp. TaxID=575652 RepID=UPI0026332BA9|nr:LytTR family DNA-binding domain-containing protein [uncultured Aquimarina sp.]